MSTFSDQLQEALGPNYQLEGELSGGGMSRVFRATDRVLGRAVVVKVLPPELAADVNRERFRREIQLAAQLQHPHIVPLLSAGEHGALLWYTMPFIEGESLRAVLDRKQALPVRDVVRILHDIVDALAYAHRRGVIHRDIKPANILRQGAHALVTDFGVAKAINAALPAFGSTSGGMAIGTPAYMAPEQLAGDPEADARLDLYAVGLLAYELLTGVGPFTNLSPRETLTAQLTRDPAPLSEVNPAVPPALSTLVTRLLAKDPAGRPPNADAVVEELDAMTMPIAIQPSRGAGRPRGAKRALVGAAITVVLIAAAVTIPALHRRDLAAAAAAERIAARAHADSVAKRKPAPRPRSIVLTHADSIAIFERVNQQVEAAHMADSVASARLRDSLNTVETARQRDSLATVIATMTPRRVAVRDRPSPTGGWPDAIGLEQAVADSLRHALSGRREFIVLPPDSAAGRGRGPPGRGPRGGGSGQFNRGAPGAGPPSGNLIVTVTFEPLPGDSALLRFDLRDPAAVQANARKELDGPHMPRALAMGGLDARLSEVISALDEMAGAPRATPPD